MKIIKRVTLIILLFFCIQGTYAQRKAMNKAENSCLLDSLNMQKGVLVADNVCHVIMHGQSLMLGTRSVPLLSQEQKYNTLMFKGGIRLGYDVDSNFYGAFAYLKEKISVSPRSGGQLGETPASGFSELFLDLLLQKKDISYNYKTKTISGWNNQLLISSPAQGSTAVASLLNSKTYWERFKNDVAEGYRLAKEAGKFYNVPLILWNQGERDIDIHTSAETYKDHIKEFQQKANRYIKSVTHQKNDVRIILYQTSSHNVRKALGNPEIANAQYELAKTEPFVTMSNATYQLPYASDHVHLSNVGSKWNGANHAVAAQSILVDKINWRPIFVKKIEVENNEININFHVPNPPLVFDESVVNNPGNYGFKVFDKNNQEMQILRVSIEGKDNVKILIKEKPQGGYVWYGNNGKLTGPLDGARGNLRDSQGDKIAMQIGEKSIRIDNWTPIFREAFEVK